MALERCAPRHSCIDILDRVLDKGLVIDAWLRVSIAGIELVGVDARVVVASIPTYVRSSAIVAAMPIAARPTSTAPLAAAPPRPRRQQRQARRRVRTVYRCEHGCTFVLKRAARSSTIACPFDGGRVCAVTSTPVA